MAADRGGDIVEIDGETFGFDDELFDLLPEKVGTLRGGGAGELGDDSADAGMGFEKSVVQQLGDDFVCGVGIDLQVAGQSSDGWKGFSGN